MEENPETIPETSPETIPETRENPEKEPDPEPEASQTNPAPKRRGRPEGARDRAPRKKKVVVVEESLDAQIPPEPEAAAAPVQTPDPPNSPRTLIRDAAEHILKLKNVTTMARKAHLQEAYTKRLHSLS